MEPQTPLALPPEHKNNRKFIIIVASLFVLFTVSASLMYFVKDQLGYYPEVIQNQKNTNDNEWKTYRNAEYGFEFKYPKDYPSKDISNGVIILPTPENCQCDTPDGLKLYAYQSFDDFKKTENRVLDLNMFMQENFWLFGSTTKNINAIEWTCGDQEGPGAVELCISQNSNGNILLLYFNLHDYIKNQILSTFKFLNSTTTDISNWKTYRNEQHGFEFKYPKDLEVKELENDNKINRWEVGRQGDASNTWYMFDFGIYDTKDLSLLDFVKGDFDAEDIIKIENLYDGLYVKFKGMPGDAYFQTLPDSKRLLFFNSRLDIKSKEFSDILSTFKLIESSTAENINLQGNIRIIVEKAILKDTSRSNIHKIKLISVGIENQKNNLISVVLDLNHDFFIDSISTNYEDNPYELTLGYIIKDLTPVFNQLKEENSRGVSLRLEENGRLRDEMLVN